MSKLRNTPNGPRRGRHTARAASALVAGSLAAGLFAACSSDAHGPTEPSVAAKSPAMLIAPTNSWDAQQQLNTSQFGQMAASWSTSSGMMQPGTRSAEPITCNSYTARSGSIAQQYVAPSSTTRTIMIGTVGTLTIPGGAVKAGFTLSGSATLGSNGIRIDLYPHGTTFAKPLILSANYQGCSFRYTSPLNVFYVNDQDGILQTMPSTDNRSGNVIQALTDHFSHYMVAWS